MNDSEREALKQEIRDEMARRYGPALALVEKLTRFRRHVEADGVDLPRRRNVFLGTTMKLLGNARIEDEDGSYWDKTGINLAAGDAMTDIVRFFREGYTAEAYLRGRVSSALSAIELAAISPDETNTIFLDLTSDDTPEDMSMALWKDDGGAAALLMSVDGDGNAYFRTDTAADRDIFELSSKGVASTLKATGSAATVSNTTTETTVFSQSVPADALASQVSGSAVWNRGLRFVGYGFYQNDKGTNGTLTVRVKLGTTTLLTGTWTQGDIGTDAFMFKIEVHIWALSSSAVLAVLEFTETSRATPSGDTYGIMDVGGVNSHGIIMDKSVSVTLTSSQTFAVTFQMDAADATYTNELTAGVLQRI